MGKGGREGRGRRKVHNALPLGSVRRRDVTSSTAPGIFRKLLFVRANPPASRSLPVFHTLFSFRAVQEGRAGHPSANCEPQTANRLTRNRGGGRR